MLHPVAALYVLTDPAGTYMCCIPQLPLNKPTIVPDGLVNVGGVVARQISVVIAGVLSNDLSPMLVNELGISTSVSPEQLTKQPYPILVNPVGSVTDVNELSV